jgi:hypothetical protein
MTPCSPLKDNQHVASIFKVEDAACFHAFLLLSLFDPED